MSGAELSRLAADVGLDVVGAARAEPYAETERHIRERRARGLFADMRFTMARPEVSCHPEALLEGARTVVSAALCYFAPGPEPGPNEGCLPRYAWRDAYAELRQRLDDLGRLLGGSYRVLVDENQHVDREGAARGHGVLVRAGHHERAEAAHLLLEQAHRVLEHVRAQRVAAHQLAEIGAGVGLGHALRAHLEEFHGDTAAS